MGKFSPLQKSQISSENALVCIILLCLVSPVFVLMAELTWTQTLDNLLSSMIWQYSNGRKKRNLTISQCHKLIWNVSKFDYWDSLTYKCRMLLSFRNSLIHLDPYIQYKVFSNWTAQLCCMMNSVWFSSLMFLLGWLAVKCTVLTELSKWGFPDCSAS